MSLLALLLLVSKSDIMMLSTNKADVLADVVPDTQAAAHIGEVVTLDCNVLNVKHAHNGMEFVDCGGLYPHMLASLVVFATNVAAVGDLDQFKDKHVFVHGKLEVYKGKSEILIESKSQIESQ